MTALQTLLLIPYWVKSICSTAYGYFQFLRYTAQVRITITEQFESKNYTTTNFVLIYIIITPAHIVYPRLIVCSHFNAQAWVLCHFMAWIHVSMYVSMDLSLVKNCSLTVALRHSVKFLVVRHTKVWKRRGDHQDYLGFYTLESHHMSPSVHGLLGSKKPT